LITASEAVHKGLQLPLGKVMGTTGPIVVHIENKAAIDIGNVKGLTQRVQHIKNHDASIHLNQGKQIH
jgi:hypothetical protein